MMDSKGEAQRYLDLKVLQQAGKISALRRQTPFALHALSHLTGLPEKVGEYRADFTYVRAGLLVVEDFKGAPLTDLYKWKRKHMLIEYNITILETRAPTRRKARR